MHSCKKNLQHSSSVRETLKEISVRKMKTIDKASQNTVYCTGCVKVLPEFTVSFLFNDTNTEKAWTNTTLMLVNGSLSFNYFSIVYNARVRMEMQRVE